MLAVLDLHPDLLVPGMAVEIGPDQVAVLRYLVEGVGRAVSAGECASCLHEIEERSLPLVRERQLPRRVEEHEVVLPESRARESSRVARRLGVEVPRPIPEIDESALDEREIAGFRTLDHVVLEPRRNRVDE